jgi:hypothetical protein
MGAFKYDEIELEISIAPLGIQWLRMQQVDEPGVSPRRVLMSRAKMSAEMSRAETSRLAGGLTW